MQQEKIMADTLKGKQSRRGLSFWFAVVWIILIASVSLCADLLPLQEYDHIDWENLSAPPGTQYKKTAHLSSTNSVDTGVYLLGADTLGRDILSRLIFGTRISLIVGLTVPAISFGIGGILGLLAGYYRGKAGAGVMAVMDVILAFPGIVLLLAITFYFGTGIVNVVIALGILVVPAFTRVARVNTLKVGQHDFVQAARMLGHSDGYIMFVEILPNIIVPMVAYGLMVVAYMIMVEGALSFLGLSVPPPVPSWGGMIVEGKAVLDEAPHITLFPSLAMFLTILSFNLLADELRTRFDQREGRI
jgi:peptide/nickel transport system permease protein